MNNETDMALHATVPDTTEIAIRDDDRLKNGDMDLVARRIQGCPKLESFAITNSSLTDARLDKLYTALFNHPMPLSLDFSGHQLDDYSSLRKLVAGYDKPVPNSDRYTSIPGNPRIHTLDISRSNRQPVRPDKYYGNFIANVLNADTLVNLKASGDPWSVIKHGDMTKYLDKCWNILTLDFYDIEDTERAFAATITRQQKLVLIRSTCDRNTREAERVLERITKGNFITKEDCDALRYRLPVVLYLAREHFGSERAAEYLETYAARAQAELKIDIGLGQHIIHPAPPPEAKPKAVAPVAAPAVAIPVAPDTAEIKSLLSHLPALTEVDVRAQLDRGMINPMELASLGQDTVRALGKVSVASLRVMTTMPTMESTSQLMQVFLQQFREVETIINVLDQNSAATSFGQSASTLSRPAPKKSWSFASLFAAPEDPNTFAAASAAASKAAKTLESLLPHLEAIGQSVTIQLETTQFVVSAFASIAEQLKLIHQAGSDTLKKWRAALPVQDQSDGALHPDPLYVSSLTSRLDYLGAQRDLTLSREATHIIHAGMIQNQRDRCVELIEQTFPLLTEEVSSFARQLSSASTAGSAGSASPNRDIAAAATTLRTINAQLLVINNLLGSIDENGDQVRGHISQLFPSTSPVHTPILTRAAPA